MNTIEQIRLGIADSLEEYEKMLERGMHADQQVLQQVLAYINSKRGKQLRPILVLYAAKLCGSITAKTLQTAVVMEMLHTASLVHDDVVDDSPTRRGAPAVHSKWTNKVAVLAGDYMLARVIGITAEVRNTRILNIVAQLGQSLSSGEVLQLHNGQSMWIEEEQYFRVIEQKTAQLFAACCEAGAESAAGTQKQVAALRVFGQELGICFQIKDDILDYSDSEVLGKPTMQDVRDNKATLPLLISLKRAPKAEAQQIRALAEALAAKDSRIDESEAEEQIRNFVLRYDGIGYATQKIQEHRQRAQAALSVFRPSETKQNLISLLDYAINRIH